MGIFAERFKIVELLMQKKYLFIHVPAIFADFGSIRE
jgi:hypothetical protein